MTEMGDCYMDINELLKKKPEVNIDDEDEEDDD